MFSKERVDLIKEKQCMVDMTFVWSEPLN